MSERRDINHIGEEIKDALEDALTSMDFHRLNETISSTVNGALEEVRKQVDAATQRAGRPYKEKVQEATRERQKVQEHHSYKQQQAGHIEQKKYPVAIKQRQVGSVSSVLYTVFGGIGTGVCGILTIVFGSIALFSAGVNGLLGLGISAVLLMVFLGMIGKGSVQRARLERFRRYMKCCAGRTYCDIKQLAAMAGRSSKFVLKDLKKMLQLKMLPEGHLDEKGTCLMLDDATYRQYLESERAYENKQSEAERRATEEAKAQKEQAAQEAELTEEEKELAAMIAEGQEYIKNLRELNDRIPGEVISDKLYRLENVLREIFATLKEHPRNRFRMRKFMDYYLPTTLKLVQAYADFDSVAIQGENIVSAKSEIEQSLDTINKAFEKLLDDLYQEAAFDAATDAQVLKTLLAQEGLAEDEVLAEVRK